MILNCPACQRKLISHTSPCCNWCGHEIQDASYQAEAELRRQAHAIEEAQHAAQSRQWFQNTIDAYAPGGLGINVPLGPARRPRMDMSQDVRRRMEAEAAIIAEAARARQAQEAYEAQQKAYIAQREAERSVKAQQEEEARKKAQDDRFHHLEL